MENTLIKVRNGEVVSRLFEEAVRGSGASTWLNPGASTQCVESFGRFFSTVCKAIPDPDLTVESMVLKGDRVMVRYKLQGTPQTDFMGISANGQAVAINGLDVFRINDGKVVEHWDTVYQIRLTT